MALEENRWFAWRYCEELYGSLNIV